MMRTQDYRAAEHDVFSAQQLYIVKGGQVSCDIRGNAREQGLHLPQNRKCNIIKKLKKSIYEKSIKNIP